MIKKLGRFVMFGIAATFIAFSIVRIIDCVNAINAGAGWDAIIKGIESGDWSKMTVFTDMGWGILYILVGLSALAVAISGHAGFWTFIASGLMLGFFIFDMVTAVKGGKGMYFIRNLSLDIIFQLIYVAGILLVMYGNHRENKAYRKYKKNR